MTKVLPESNLLGYSSLKAIYRTPSYEFDGFNRYDLRKIIGEGSFGKVWKAMDKKTGEFVAIKVVSNDNDCTQREIEFKNSGFDHPNIVKILDVVPMKQTNSVCLVMEYVNGGDLLELVQTKPLDARKARYLFKQIVEAVKYFHDNGYCHRDLKLENILLDQSHTSIKLTDFGFTSKIGSNDIKKSFLGSPIYAAPEIYSKALPCGTYSDCWSLGVVLFTMVTGLFPFPGVSTHQQVKNACLGKYFHNPLTSASFQDLIDQLLQVNALLRPCTEDILKHPWLNE